MKWEAHLRKRTPAAVARLERANEKLISQALALQDIDADDGVFSHEVKVLRSKLATRSGFAGKVLTEWTPTGA